MKLFSSYIHEYNCVIQMPDVQEMLQSLAIYTVVMVLHLIHFVQQTWSHSLGNI
jgi:ABC-type uncharacterized transport system fused permease/ATPase subunit